MSRKNRNNDFFWISYADLMTTLFFVMLVLFALTVIYLKVKQKEVETEKEKLEQILQLEEQFKSLNEDKEFEYLEECKKFIVKEFKGIEIFEPNKAEILLDYKERTIEAGRNIEKFLNKLEVENKGFSFLLVIEGNMANRFDGSIDKNSKYGYEISYARALAVYNLWHENGIDFRKENVEVIISGSGFNGICRDKIEENNKRFSIQILPKVTNAIER